MASYGNTLNKHRDKGFIIGKKETKNVERPQSSQELALLETQNVQLQKGIATAESQEARSNEQHQIWKDNYLPMEVQMGGQANPQEEARIDKMMDNQMPRYAEDTSGAYDRPAPQQPQANIGGSAKGSRGSAKGGRNG